MPELSSTVGSNGIHYLTQGNGPPLVLIHAFPLDARMWQPQLLGLATQACVIAPDVYGFGGTPLPGTPWTVDSMADGLAELLVSMGITERIVLGGLSMGGYIALAFARRHPDRLRGLILADTRAEADSDDAKAARDGSVQYVRENGSAAFFEQKMLPKVISDQSRAARPSLASELVALAAAQTTDGVVAGLLALKTRPDATSQLSTIRVPTLVVCGSDDVITPPALSEVMANAIPNAKLELIAGVGHLSNLEAPEAFNTAIARFIGTSCLA